MMEPVLRLPRRYDMARTRAVVALVAVGVPATVAVFTLVAWWNRTGCFSYRNYERIETGMLLEEVDGLLGRPGEEIPPEWVSTVPPWAKISGSPAGWLGVVWGDRFFLWKSGHCEVFVGVTDGRVTSKWYWEPSL
jgi:hypothetical protein